MINEPRQTQKMRDRNHVKHEKQKKKLSNAEREPREKSNSFHLFCVSK